MALDSNAERRIGIYLAVGAVLGLAMLGTWWFVGNFERVEVDVRRGYSQEARRNPFLAAERYLARLDLDVRSIAGRDLLLNSPSEPGTLIINNFGPDLSAGAPDSAHRVVALGWAPDHQRDGVLGRGPGQKWQPLPRRFRRTPALRWR